MQYCHSSKKTELTDFKMPQIRVPESATIHKKFTVKSPPKSSTERNREYRARKKALKNAHKSPSFVPKTPAQCSREYRARQKALRNATNHNSLDSTATDVQAEVHQENSPSSLAKTPAQRSREYRARKRALKTATDQNSSVPRFLPKTPAQCSRDYRARKRALKNATVQDSLDFTSIISQAEGYQQNSPSFLLKTTAQCSRDYRARKRDLMDLKQPILETPPVKIEVEVDIENFLFDTM
ncbi:uncharacterized protein LOC123692033 isoform X2 [Colias croceus]|uniref:uncharacterized protein LOC123692033 isoform X2 n=2 Tax=Colias crocea TaxID=72248 RepID=UPI001E27B1AB|nr:uncharacterized protein LOC123692033 isoform X2 [Colias croceus]